MTYYAACCCDPPPSGPCPCCPDDEGGYHEYAKFTFQSEANRSFLIEGSACDNPPCSTDFNTLVGYMASSVLTATVFMKCTHGFRPYYLGSGQNFPQGLYAYDPESVQGARHRTCYYVDTYQANSEIICPACCSCGDPGGSGPYEVCNGPFGTRGSNETTSCGCVIGSGDPIIIEYAATQVSNRKYGFDVPLPVSQNELDPESWYRVTKIEASAVCELPCDSVGPICGTQGMTVCATKLALIGDECDPCATGEEIGTWCMAGSAGTYLLPHDEVTINESETNCSQQAPNCLGCCTAGCDGTNFPECRGSCYQPGGTGYDNTTFSEYEDAKIFNLEFTNEQPPSIP